MEKIGRLLKLEKIGYMVEVNAEIIMLTAIGNIQCEIKVRE